MEKLTPTKRKHNLPKLTKKEYNYKERHSGVRSNNEGIMDTKGNLDSSSWIEKAGKIC